MTLAYIDIPSKSFYLHLYICQYIYIVLEFLSSSLYSHNFCNFARKIDKEKFILIITNIK